MSNSWVKYSCSGIELRKPRNFCPTKITRYTVFYLHMLCVLYQNIVFCLEHKFCYGYTWITTLRTVHVLYMSGVVILHTLYVRTYTKVKLI